MEYDTLKLENQLCFPLYACAREVVKKYKPLLDELDLTYTQYIVMMVLWERGSETVKGLGISLHLDSGTLTPLLKRLEYAGLITRARDANDERNLIVSLTDAGRQLKVKAQEVPAQIGKCINLSPAEAVSLYQLLYKLLNELTE